MLAKLTSIQQAAHIFAKTEPKLAVYSHIVNKELSGDKGDHEIEVRTRAAGYAGPLLIGKDRTVILVGETVRVFGAKKLEDLPDLDKKLTYAE